MKVFLQNNMVDHLVLPVLDWARRYGHTVIDQSCVVDTDLDKHHDWIEPTIIVGSVGLMKQCKAHPKASKWIHYNNTSFDANEWKKAHGDDYLNSDGIDLAVWEVPDYLEKNGDKHLRPSYDDKMFIGGIYDVAKWNEAVKERQIDPEGRVFAASIKKIDIEARYWVHQGRIVDGCIYRKDGKFSKERIDPLGFSKYRREVEQIIKNYAPADMYVMDIAIVNDFAYLLEYNPIHGAGWYCANVDRIMNTWEAMYDESVYFDSTNFLYFKIEGDLKYGRVTTDNIDLYATDDTVEYSQTFTFDSWHRFKSGIRHSYSKPAVELMQSTYWYLHGQRIDENEYINWINMMGMDIDNLTPEDKILIDLKWKKDE